jgi:hypothetical protein
MHLDRATWHRWCGVSDGSSLSSLAIARRMDTIAICTSGNLGSIVMSLSMAIRFLAEIGVVVAALVAVDLPGVGTRWQRLAAAGAFAMAWALQVHGHARRQPALAPPFEFALTVAGPVLGWV